jgi:hypothetical protein
MEKKEGRAMNSNFIPTSFNRFELLNKEADSPSNGNESTKYTSIAKDE